MTGNVRPRHAAFQPDELLAEQADGTRPYLEFLRRESLSAGLYVLPAGADDFQAPHTEDEVYVVLEGDAVLRADEHDTRVGPGSILFVAATVPHRFHSIASDLKVLVFFAPAEYSNTRAPAG